MATYTFSVTRDDIIKAAMRVTGKLGPTQAPNANQISFASQALNILVKEWMSKGATLWKIQEIIVALAANTSKYLLGPSATGATDPSGAPFLVRPLRILDQGNFIRTLATSTDTPITMVGRSEYEMYGAKTSLGVVNSFFYDPQLTNGLLFVYPTPATSSTQVLHLFGQIPIADFNAAADLPDFPQEWFAALKYGLAREMVIEYGADETTERRIERRYQEALDSVLNFSVDEASAYFTYNNRFR